VASINVGAGGSTSYILIIGAIIAIVGLILPNFLKNLMGGKIGVAVDAVCATVGSPITDAPEEKTRCGGRSIDMGSPTTLDAYEATALISYAQGDTCHFGPEFDINCCTCVFKHYRLTTPPSTSKK
jgi:hypothetical protein